MPAEIRVFPNGELDVDDQFYVSVMVPYIRAKFAENFRSWAKHYERWFSNYEADKDPDRPATVVAIGVHPFVMGTPAGAAAFRRVLEALKEQPLVWLTDTDSVFAASGQKP